MPEKHPYVCISKIHADTGNLTDFDALSGAEREAFREQAAAALSDAWSRYLTEHPEQNGGLRPQ